ncbi:hypothetical protein SLE2022_223500 [Rubroshorea leprosula]
MNGTARIMLILAFACVFACYLALCHEIPSGKHQLLIRGKESDEKLPTTFLGKFNKAAGTVFLLLIGATLNVDRTYRSLVGAREFLCVNSSLLTMASIC